MAAASALKLQIEGMDCAACALKIEADMARQPGVSDINVSYTGGTLALNVDPDRTSQHTIEEKIRALGYKPAGSASQAEPALPTKRVWEPWWQGAKARVVFITGALFAAAFIAFATASKAHDYRAGDIEVGHPWSRPTPPSAKVAGGYIKLTNTGSEPDRLISVTSSMARRAEIHRSAVENGVARMRPLDGVTIEPGMTVDFEAERLHFMFIEPARPLRNGERFPATLVFERAGSIDVNFMVQMRASGPAGEDHSGHGGSQ